MYSLLYQFSNQVGMVGVVLLLLAYFLLSMGKMSSHSLGYQVLNLIGAIFILFSLFFHFNLSSFVIEIAWILISFVGIYRIKKAYVLSTPASNVTHINQKRRTK